MLRFSAIALVLLFLSTAAFTQIKEYTEPEGSRAVSGLGKLFADKAVQTVIIKSSITLNETINIPPSKTLKIEPGCRISGSGTINGGIIDAGYRQHIFGPDININPTGVQQYFSACWFGAGDDGKDDHFAIQKAINTCITSAIKTLFIPSGYYRITRPLIVRGNGADSVRRYCTLEIIGESSFWDSNTGTEIKADFTDGFAIGIQRGKGCKVRRIRFTGVFEPPKFSNSVDFYKTDFKDFKDGKCRDVRFSPYAAIVIDPFTNIADARLDTTVFYPGLSQYYGTNGRWRQSGSTATEIEDVSITNFVVGICSSPNGITRNAELTLINKVQFAACKLCISGGQDQEKDNRISNIACWGRTHTIFATGLYGGYRMAGNWHIDHVNLAGTVNRFIYNDQHGYFPTYISNVYAESLGTWGVLNSQLACQVSDCIVDFAYLKEAGSRTLITSWGKNVVYRSCNFRFYGTKDPIIVEGDATFDHCFFSGPIEKKAGLTNIFPNWMVPGNSFNIVAGMVLLLLLILGFCYYSKRRLRAY